MTDLPLRIVFAGTPDFAAKHLDALCAPELENIFRVTAVFTQPDRRAGRGKKYVPGPVKTRAESLGIPVFQPASLRDPEALKTLAAQQPDVMVVVAYGLLLPLNVLNLPVFGCINVHASLLPRWRGAAPIERAILEGDTETGVSIMQMDEGLDTGPVLATRSTQICTTDNALTLADRLAALGTEALIETLQALPSGKIVPVPQADTGISYAAKLTREEAEIDWTQPADTIARQVQAFFPRSPAYTFMAGERVMVLASEAITGAVNTSPGVIVSADKSGLIVQCGQGCLMVTRVQPAGKNAMGIADLLNGRRELYSPGARFSLPGTGP